MSQLELELRDVGGALEFPPTPDLARAVTQRLAERRQPMWRLRSRRQLLAVALAVLAVSAAAVMAVPSARTAVLRFLRIGAVTVERVETLPRAEERPLTAGFGPALRPDVAARRAGFRMLLPPLDDPPERIHVLGGLQAVILDVPDAGPVLLLEIRGRDQFDFLGKKLAEPATVVVETSVNGNFALWLEGAPHVVFFRDRTGRIRDLTTRLAGNVLVWQQGDLTLRLEGELTQEQALELARALK